MNDVERSLKSILDNNLDSKEFSYFLFGSRAQGNARKNSDYDIGVLGKKKLGLRKYVSLKRKLNDAVNYPVDVVDFNRVGKDFKVLALKNIKLWNKGESIKGVEQSL